MFTNASYENYRNTLDHFENRQKAQQAQNAWMFQPGSDAPKSSLSLPEFLGAALKQMLGFSWHALSRNMRLSRPKHTSTASQPVNSH
ncbi:MAG: hypothetical protein EXR62_03685 [Chloroflexi bacterium]|nr:hypothetical protein [Chloroflexota bacterium]